MPIDVARLAGPLSEFMTQISGKNGETRFQEFLLWLKRVGQMILVTGINRSLSNEQAVEAGSWAWWYKNQAELDKAPWFEATEVVVEFVEFNHDPSTVEVNSIYIDGWVPDFGAAARYMELHPEAADDRPIAIQWSFREDGTAAYAIWLRDGSKREVNVNRHDDRWDRRYRFARFRKVSAVA